MRNFAIVSLFTFAVILHLIGLALVGGRPEQALIDVQSTPVRVLEPAVRQSTENALLMRLASEHAKRQARNQRQSHDDFAKRASEIQSQLKMSSAEICAESWKWQENSTPEELWGEMYRSWRQSPGHWSVASVQHKYWGYAMAKGDNGIWYACIIVAD